MERTRRMLQGIRMGQCGLGICVGTGLLLWAAFAGWGQRAGQADPAVEACSHLISAQICDDEASALAYVREAGSLLARSEEARLHRELRAVYLEAALAIIGAGLVIATLFWRLLTGRRCRRRLATTTPQGRLAWRVDAAVA